MLDLGRNRHLDAHSCKPTFRALGFAATLFDLPARCCLGHCSALGPDGLSGHLLGPSMGARRVEFGDSHHPRRGLLGPIRGREPAALTIAVNEAADRREHLCTKGSGADDDRADSAEYSVRRPQLRAGSGAPPGDSRRRGVVDRPRSADLRGAGARRLDLGLHSRVKSERLEPPVCCLASPG